MCAISSIALAVVLAPCLDVVSTQNNRGAPQRRTPGFRGLPGSDALRHRPALQQLPLSQ
jgi:hypothetical protein